MCIVSRLVCDSIHRDRLGFASVTNDLYISVTYSNAGAFLVHAACPLRIGCGFLVQAVLVLAPRRIESNLCLEHCQPQGSAKGDLSASCTELKILLEVTHILITYLITYLITG